MKKTAVSAYNGKRFHYMHCGTVGNMFYSYSTVIAYLDNNVWHVRKDYKTFSRTTTKQTHMFMSEQEFIFGRTWIVDWVIDNPICDSMLNSDFYYNLRISF